MNDETSYFTYAFLIMIPSIFIYLSKFTETKGKRILYVTWWIIGFVILEWIGVNFFNSMNHDNGWNIWWSLLFDSVMFPMLRLHFVNYKLSLLLSIPCILILLFQFNHI
ncbi:hypothetical protein BIV60_24250 [Bacillus sp. MUM 116]|nr:hypothetical protein BIV60_24250 [Bacillus sp. MUM 116]